MHIIINLPRIVEFALGKTPIEVFRDNENSVALDKQTYKLYYFIWLGLVILAVSLDILCCKYRQIARLIFPMEMINLTLFHSLPYEPICGEDMN